MANDKKMRRGVQQALYKYLPGSWVDYTQSGGGVTYAVHVDYWNSIQLSGINNKRLLRIVNQRVHEFIEHSSEGIPSAQFTLQLNRGFLYAVRVDEYGSIIHTTSSNVGSTNLVIIAESI